MALSAKKYVIEQEYALPREIVWKLLSDTDRLNRFIGLFSVQFSAARNRNSKVFFRDASAKVAGIIPIAWREYPFQWIENESYEIERHYQGGPLKHFIGGVELFDSDKIDQGTKVRLFGEFTPLNMFGMVGVVSGLKSMKKTMAYIDEYLKMKHEGKDHDFPQKPSTIKINTVELSRLEKALSNMPVNTSYIHLLHHHLLLRSDQDMTKMRPILIAKQWNADPKQVLRLFLYATKAGILNLSWNIICPNCRVSKVEHSSLSQLTGQFHCDLCGVDYDADFEKYVELSFSVHPSIRKAVAETYCIGGPMITPHVKIQKVIEKNKAVQFKIPSTDEALRIRVLQANDIVAIEKTTASLKREMVISYDDQGWSESSVSIEPGDVSFHVHNSSSKDIVVVLEKADWSNEAITAAKVTVMQEFRDLFSSEVLSPSEQVGVGKVTILFSDLQGSTSLYESIGDANAYGQVRKHFDYLTQWISRHSGSVVKTIGDAVMAAFHLPEDALKAAIQIQKHVSEFNRDNRDEIILKIGIYSGPAIVVNSNGRLDYFGRTVNIAARIQGQSTGNDIVFSRHELDKEVVCSILQEEKVDIKPFDAVLKGINGHFDLIRVSL